MVLKIGKGLGLKIPEINDINFKKFSIFERSWTFPKKEHGKWKSKILIKGKKVMKGIELLKAGLHELGHAIHNLNQPESYSTLDKFLISSIVKETASGLFENLLSSIEFLQDVCKLSLKEAEAVKENFEKYLNLSKGLQAVKWKFKMEYAERNWSVKQVESRYIFYCVKYMKYSPKIKPRTTFDIFYPPMYEGNYAISFELVQYVIKDLEENFGKKWWKDPTAGKWLKENLFKLRSGDPIPHLENVLRMKLL